MKHAALLAVLAALPAHDLRTVHRHAQSRYASASRVCRVRSLRVLDSIIPAVEAVAAQRAIAL